MVNPNGNAPAQESPATNGVSTTTDPQTVAVVGREPLTGKITGLFTVELSPLAPISRFKVGKSEPARFFLYFTFSTG
jgi:hypothetical protein